jgi:hypothetical protein
MSPPARRSSALRRGPLATSQILEVGVGRYLIGVACGGVAFTPVALGARALRRRHLPLLYGPPAALAEIIIGLALVVCVSELLGSVGLFRLVPIVVAFAGSGVAALRLAGSRTIDQSRDPESATVVHLDRWEPWTALGAVALVAAEWTTRAADSFQRGMSATADTLWYHMPVAARFVQSGWTPRLHFSDGHSLTVFYPATSELLHALGILFVGNDVLSPFVNLFWLSLALLAAWCVGRPFGVAPLSLIGIAVVLATPELVLDDAGSALNDVVGLALLLSAVAFLVAAKASDDREPGQGAPGAFVCAALAAGLALGTKYTLIPAVGVLSIAALCLQQPRKRARRAGLWAAALALTGSYWYLRNLVTTGNPLPSLNLGIGPVRLPSIPFPGASRVADYMFDRHDWSTYLLPGLRDALGPAWWAVLLLAGAGCALGALLSRSRVVRVVALVGFASFIAFLYSPQILGLGRAPIYFVVNVRYVAPALVVGIAILPVVASRFGRLARLALLGSFGAVLVATQFDRGIWQNAGTHISQTTAGSSPRVWGVVIGILIVVAGVGLWSWARRVRRSHTSASVRAVCVVLAALVAVGFPLEQRYLSDRYRNAPPMPQIFRWARDTHHARIAIVGFFVQYPLYGSDLSNHVQYVAHRGRDHRSSRIADCVAWRQAINDGRYDYVVATNPGFPFPSKQPALEVNWTRSDPAASLLISESINGAHAWLFRIDGRLDPSGCTAPS